MRGKNLCVHGEDAKRILAYSPNTPKDIKVCIYRLIIIQMLKILDSFYLNYMGWIKPKKTISRYWPFKPSAGVFFDVLRMFDFSGVALLTCRSTRATAPSFLAFPLRWLHGLYYVV
jgi:hypothetical protein